MSRTKRLLTTTACAVPLALAVTLGAAAASAAGLIEAAKNTGQFTTLVKALEQSGMAQQLKGEGPFTVFAPTDAAFESLPQGVVDGLMKDESKGQLTRLLEHHVVQGRELMLEDALGKETQVGTLSQDRLTVDGTKAVTVVVPTGLKITQIGDELFTERTAAVTTLPAVTVGSAAAQGGQPQGQPARGAQQAGQGAPAHQAQAAQQQAQPAQQQGGQAASPQPQPVQGAQQAGPGAPQQQAQAAESGQRAPLDRQEGIFRAAVITQPQVEADNGVIHGINEVLIPQSLEQALTQMSAQGTAQQQGAAQPKPTAPPRG